MEGYGATRAGGGPVVQRYRDPECTGPVFCNDESRTRDAGRTVSSVFGGFDQVAEAVLAQSVYGPYGSRGVGVPTCSDWRDYGSAEQEPRDTLQKA
jgi:hypothetical protein